jgi:hypothetical protein
MGNISNTGNMGNMGNISNMGNTGNMGNTSNMGNTGNMGNMGNISNMVNMGNISNMGNICVRKIITKRISNMSATVQDETTDRFRKARSCKVCTFCINEITAEYKKMNLQTLITLF